jgi:hypothetical protein
MALFMLLNSEMQFINDLINHNKQDMNLKLVLPILFAVIFSCAFADGLLMNHALRSGIEADNFIMEHVHMKKVRKALTTPLRHEDYQP